jgi:hypothetical protein
MSELKRIQELTPKFQGTILSTVNSIETILNEIIAVDITHDPKDIYKRVHFFKYFENFGLQNKIELVKLILTINYPKILEKFPLFFTELGDVKKMRDTVAHNYIAYEADPQGEKAKLLLEHPIIKKQRKLTERQMQGLIKKVEKIIGDARKIHKLVGKTKSLNF